MTASSAARQGVSVRHRLGATALAVLVALSLSACGVDDVPKEPKASPSVNLPTGNVDVPADVTLTKAGTELEFGEPAVVAYEPNSNRSSVLSMSVESVQTGKMSDFAAYQLDARTRASTPYYVRVKVENVGHGDLSRTAVPLLAVDSSDTLIQPSSFNNTFKKCPSTPLPAGFTAGESAKLCLVYLVPEGGTLTEMSFRPLQAFEPIVWQGKIEPAAGKDKKGKKSKKGKNKKKGRR